MPSFESAWLTISAQADTGSQLVIPHGLGEYPVKVDVQVRVVDNGDYYIFSGTGSAHRDDDDDSYYGGIIYIYDTVDVRVYAPSGTGSFYSTKGLVAYTGGTRRTGSTLIGGSYTSGEVKVRAWKLCEIGSPAFYHQWTAISGSSAYHEISHNLGVYPDLVTVQIDLDNTDYMSDAQGSNCFLVGSAGVSNTGTNYQTGGVIFGYDTTKIRLWASSGGYVFNAFDGWGENDDWRYSSGKFRIICWIFPASEILFQYTLEMGLGVTSTYEIPFGTDFDTDGILLSTEITVSDGNNPGFRFYGLGNALTDGSFAAFGGVVYVYTENQILLWRPSDSSSGKMVYHNTVWAGGHMNQMSDTAEVTIRVMIAIDTVNGACGHGSCVATMSTGDVACTCDPNWSGRDCKTEVTTTTTQTTTTVPLTTTTTQTTTAPATTTTTQTTTAPPTTTTEQTTTVTPTTTTTQATTAPPTTTTEQTTTAPHTTTTEQTTTVPFTTTTEQTTNVPVTTTTEQTTTSPPSTTIHHPTTTPSATTQTTTTEGATTTVKTTATVTGGVCGQPTAVTHTNFLYEDTSHGSRLLYSCYSGYTMTSGDQIHTCSGSVWTGTLPVCAACPTTYTPVITTQEELTERLDVLKKNTEVDAKNTTSYKRSLVCASDPRPSALYVATVGIIILSLVGLFPLLADGINLYERFGNFFRQNMHSPSKGIVLIS
ncbi:uncharacterized protein [Argopecten irradians]|uniref:uncharacterized protein n=1 Tax=Argopecten irradians TaxID=31199 RepID=UPI003710E838